MKDVPIENAMVAWNPDNWVSRKHGLRKPDMVPGDVGVCEHPDNGQLRHLTNWVCFKQSFPADAPEMSEKEIRVACLQLKMMVEAWHMMGRDRVPFMNIHRALSRIPEYRDLLSSDFEIWDEEES